MQRTLPKSGPAPARVRLGAILLPLLLLSAPLALALEGADAPTLVVHAGSVRLVDGLLESAGDLVIDGEVRALHGDLVLRAAGDLVVRGRVVGAHGAPGEPGGSVFLLAGGTIQVAQDAFVGAGPGGHGASAIVPDGVALAERGGDGGRVVVEALSTVLDGVLAPGRGGDGGHAYGIEAFGGDGGTSGGLVVNDALAPVRALATQAEAQAPLADLLPVGARSHCSPEHVVVPALAGANGGDACAHGRPGQHGANGNPGADDNCNSCTLKNYPECGAYTTVDGDNRNGEAGQNGGTWVEGGASDATPPTQGGAANAVGGTGGHVVGAGIQAGNGGSAVATGAPGGDGGDGGEGGHAGTKGKGCTGGRGGYGAPGGNGVALAGGQGLNPTDCPRNGSPGTAAASGGLGGGAGDGGEGGGPDGRKGSTGAAGKSGSDGYGSRDVPPSLVCVAPGSPTVVTSYNALRGCSRVRLLITEPVSTGTSAAVTEYEIFRNDTFGNMRWYDKITNMGSPQTYFDGAVAEGTSYTYVVKAWSTLGPGGTSSPMTQTTACVGAAVAGVVGTLLPALDAPTLIAAPGSGPGHVDLTITWLHSTAVDSFNVYRAPEVGPFGFIKNIPYGGTTTLTDDTGLPLTPYRYMVRAVVGSVEGPDSNVVYVVTPLMTVGPGLVGDLVPACVPRQDETHMYVGAARPVFAAEGSALSASMTGWYEQGVRAVTDSCTEDVNGDGVPLDHDGEWETAAGGGRFPAGSNRAGCLSSVTPHHAYGVGAEYWASDDTGVASLAYAAGADGPSLVPDPSNPCATDGLITNDPLTGPFDCGAGATGLHAGGFGWIPATLGENVAGSGACDPYDGTVWVTIAAGPYVTSGGVIVSTPIQGRIWSSEISEPPPPPPAA